MNKLKFPKNGPKNKSATKNELSFIRKNYGQMTAKQISKILKRSVPAIQHIIHRFKIKRNTKQRSYNVEDSSYGIKYSAYKCAAKNRGYSFKLTKKQFKTLAQQNCHYCNSEPKLINPWKRKSAIASRSFKKLATIKFNGIDRLNNKKSYIFSNCVSCCTICNMMKETLSKTNFLNHIDKIAKFYKYNNKDHLVDCKAKK